MTRHDQTSPAGALTVPSNGASGGPGVTDGAAAASAIPDIINGAAKTVATATRFMVVFIVISFVSGADAAGRMIQRMLVTKNSFRLADQRIPCCHGARSVRPRVEYLWVTAVAAGLSTGEGREEH
ncbi:hypothetical protein, partial [Nocardia cyriacigeorgica]